MQLWPLLRIWTFSIASHYKPTFRGLRLQMKYDTGGPNPVSSLGMVIPLSVFDISKIDRAHFCTRP